MVAAAALLALALARAADPLVLPLQVRVARCADAAWIDGPPANERVAAFVDRQVEAAQALYAPLGITLRARVDEFTPVRCQLETRADRDALADAVPAAANGVVTVLVLPRVRDLDVPSYNLQGVHWRAGGRRWVFITGRAKPPVLAHELAHFFGLPHDPAGGNLMTPGPSSPAWKSPHPPAPFQPRLTPAQQGRLRKNIARFIAGTKVQPR